MHTQAALEAMWAAVWWKLAIVCLIPAIVTWWLFRDDPRFHLKPNCRCKIHKK